MMYQNKRSMSMKSKSILTIFTCIVLIAGLIFGCGDILPSYAASRSNGLKSKTTNSSSKVSTVGSDVNILFSKNKKFKSYTASDGTGIFGTSYETISTDRFTGSIFGKDSVPKVSGGLKWALNDFNKAVKSQNASNFKILKEKAEEEYKKNKINWNYSGRPLPSADSYLTLSSFGVLPLTGKGVFALAINDGLLTYG